MPTTWILTKLWFLDESGVYLGMTARLPPYSPDFNPIELCWSKVKQALRRAKAKTAEAVLTALADACAQCPTLTFATGFAIAVTPMPAFNLQLAPSVRIFLSVIGV